jgi:hypothetical protein
LGLIHLILKVPEIVLGKVAVKGCLQKLLFPQVCKSFRERVQISNPGRENLQEFKHSSKLHILQTFTKLNKLNPITDIQGRSGDLTLKLDLLPNF